MKRHRFVEPAVARRIADEERSAGARRPAGELNNDDVSINVSNQQEATAQTSSWYWKLAIAKRCRLNKSIRQRFVFTLKIQQMACAMIKPAGSLGYRESAVVEFEKKPAVTNKEFSSWTFSKANPAADDLATQFQQQREIQQQREFQQQREIQQRRKLHLLHAKINILDAKQAGSVLPDFTPRFLTRAKHLRDLGRPDFRLRPVHVKPDFEFLSMTKKIEKMKVKKQLVKANHVECHQKFQARIHEAEDSMQAQHLLIEALVDEKDSLLQTIHGLQEANNAPAPFDGDWEEEPEEEEIKDIPLGEGEIDDE
ncbi:hypothetical protein F511_04154 [Dorcoceras hygrometricum]|uniref:Uncharacterized protein n=1 Tax=Dorcoceras hygrometricum TaxID=472368 RepID=A0A2Z7BKN9_9LAMI|nr:hypothetical protein F511_04154 [Dorcoceras hygrometricum]